VTVIPLLLLQKEFVKRHALDVLQFYAQYKSQITYSRAFNYYFEQIVMEITEMAWAIAKYRILEVENTVY
jgi:hypothetical protein